MVITGWEIYLLMRLDGIRNVCVSIGIFAFVFAFLFIFISFMMQEPDDTPSTKERLVASRKFGWLLSIIGCVFTVVGMFVPSTKEAIAIYVIPKVMNSEFVNNKLPKETEELYTLLKQYIKMDLAKKSEGN